MGRGKPVLLRPDIIESGHRGRKGAETLIVSPDRDQAADSTSTGAQASEVPEAALVVAVGLGLEFSDGRLSRTIDVQIGAIFL